MSTESQYPYEQGEGFNQFEQSFQDYIQSIGIYTVGDYKAAQEDIAGFLGELAAEHPLFDRNVCIIPMFGKSRIYDRSCDRQGIYSGPVLGRFTEFCVVEDVLGIPDDIDEAQTLLETDDLTIDDLADDTSIMLNLGLRLTPLFPVADWDLEETRIELPMQHIETMNAISQP